MSKSEAENIKHFSRREAKLYAKSANVKQALKHLKITQADFIKNTHIHAEEVAQAVYDITQGNIAVKDTRSEGRKARDWYAKKKGMNVQEKNMFLPKSEEIEEYAKENNCTVYQAVARMSVI